MRQGLPTIVMVAGKKFGFSACAAVIPPELARERPIKAAIFNLQLRTVTAHALFERPACSGDIGEREKKPQDAETKKEWKELRWQNFFRRTTSPSPAELQI